MVLHALEELDLPFEERSVSEGRYVEELVARGGKKQTPYLVDTERSEELYGSSEIVGYLMEHYGT